MRAVREWWERGQWRRWEHGRSPFVVSTVFWFAALTGLTSCVLELAHGGTGFAVYLILVSTVAMGGLWPWLRWDRDGSRARRALSIGFAATATVQLGQGSWMAVIVLVVVTVHLVCVFGTPVGFGYVGAVTAFCFATTWLYGKSLSVAFMESAVVGLLAAWSTAAGHMLLRDRERSRRTRELLAEQTVAHEQLRRYARRVRELTIDQERARMSREMHDSLGHHLTVIKIGLRNARRYRDRDAELAWQEVGQAAALTDTALTETRRWVKALRPLGLDGADGVDALRGLAESFPNDGYTVRFDAPDDLGELSAETELVLYRALQEGLTNVAKHSGARRVRVTVVPTADTVTLIVADDGPGRDDGEPGTGFGLAGLRHRVKELGGILDADSTPSGFTLRVELPTGADTSAGSLEAV